MTPPLPALDARSHERQWFVVRTKAKKEDFAVQQLERRGVAVFFPRVLEYGREQVAPLFPGYLFVHIALLQQYYRVVWTPGVRHFVAFGPTPTPVQDGVIYLIRSSAAEGGVIRQLSPFRPGDRVQITAGPLAGLVAVIQRPCSQHGRVQVLLDFLRQGASVELPVGLVDRV
jgi:transcription antitermination factor NusG